uniref:Uncharacterized protein n=1 Tax=Candidatus Kentrum sp. TUN TaxID=2126343 RepID=A0A451A482_9GAMM|nr:MAG: hypothetical protein BECKTUN1418D_GA0071000_11369 [Candidatus Kentron sp. TUN]
MYGFFARLTFIPSSVMAAYFVPRLAYKLCNRQAAIWEKLEPLSIAKPRIKKQTGALFQRHMSLKGGVIPT